tara:strand:- start:47 stop:631 length:585 start_codon:yes stop_codon:yes gene_type:complete
MFSGIIQGIGDIKKSNSDIFSIETSVDLSNCEIGSSISCDGVCLTATSIKKIKDKEFVFTVNISEETRNRSCFRSIDESKLINIEKSLRLGDEISGHFVYGHVDCVTQIENIQKLDNSWDFNFKKNEKMKKFIVEKGSISINGISLTISKNLQNTFSVSIIPHTFENTNLKIAKEGDSVNIEFDSLARYVLENE